MDSRKHSAAAIFTRQAIALAGFKNVGGQPVKREDAVMHPSPNSADKPEGGLVAAAVAGHDVSAVSSRSRIVTA